MNHLRLPSSNLNVRPKGIFSPSTNSLRPIARSCGTGDMDKAVGSQSPSPHDFNLFPFFIQLLKLVSLHLPLPTNLLFCDDLIFSLSPERFLTGHTSQNFFLILAPILASHFYLTPHQFIGFSRIFPKAFTIHIS